MEKEFYEKAEIEVISFVTEDVLFASGCGGTACPTEMEEDNL